MSPCQIPSPFFFLSYYLSAVRFDSFCLCLQQCQTLGHFSLCSQQNLQSSHPLHLQQPSLARIPFPWLPSQNATGEEVPFPSLHQPTLPALFVSPLTVIPSTRSWLPRADTTMASSSLCPSLLPGGSIRPSSQYLMQHPCCALWDCSTHLHG